MSVLPTTTRVYTWQFWLLCFSSTLFFASFNMIIPELPGYLEAMGGGQYKGLIIALFTVTAGVSRPFSGKLTDQWGRIPVMIFGVVVCVVASLLYPFTTTVLAFLGLRLLHGFSTGFKPTATSAFVGDVVPANRRGEALGFLGMFGTMGMGIGPFIGPTIAATWGTTTMFVISSGVAGLSVLILLGMKETLKDPMPFHRGMLRIKRREIIAPEAWPAAIVMANSVFAFGVLLTLAPDFSMHVGLPPEQKGLFFSVFTFSSLIIRFLAGRASDKWGRVLVLRAGMIILLVALVVLGTATSLPQFVVGSVLIGFAVGSNSPTLFAWTIDLTPEHIRGRGIATMYIMLEAGIGLGAVVSGFIFANQAENLMWALLSPIPFVLFALGYLIWGVKPDVPPGKAA